MQQGRIVQSKLHLTLPPSQTKGRPGRPKGVGEQRAPNKTNTLKRNTVTT